MSGEALGRRHNVRVQPEDSQADAQVALVRSMWKAWQDGPIDDVLATMHPDVIWRPAHRPARSAYLRHDGMRAMRAEIERELGKTDVTIEQIVSDPDGTVRSTGVVKFTGREASSPFEVHFTFRNGLIFIAETIEGPG